MKFLLLAAIAAPLLFFLTASGQALSTIPCADSRGCPDLLIDGSRLMADPYAPGFIDTETFAPNDCAVQEGAVDAAGNRTLLHFTTAAVNWGAGAFQVPDPALYPDLLVWAPCHQHYHFRDYAAYRLWTPAGWRDWQALRRKNPDVDSTDLLAANPSIAAEQKAGHKQGFCIVDLTEYGNRKGNGVGTELDPYSWDYASQQHNGCEYPYSGLDPTWADIYYSGIEGQWIDITGLPGGKYVLENEINPARVITEANYRNDTAAVTVVLP